MHTCVLKASIGKHGQTNCHQLVILLFMQYTYDAVLKYVWCIL